MKWEVPDSTARNRRHLAVPLVHSPLEEGFERAPANAEVPQRVALAGNVLVLRGSPPPASALGICSAQRHVPTKRASGPNGRSSVPPVRWANPRKALKDKCLYAHGAIGRRPAKWDADQPADGNHSVELPPLWLIKRWRGNKDTEMGFRRPQRLCATVSGRNNSVSFSVRMRPLAPSPRFRV